MRLSKFSLEKAQVNPSSAYGSDTYVCSALESIRTPPHPPPPTILAGVTKRCRLSWLTSIALVYESKCGGMGVVAGSQPMSAAFLHGAQIIWRST
jgi:hypothetical protein